MTLYTSDTDKASKTAFVYLLISLFCILFGAIYERFSHEIYSYYMIYAFFFPLAGGTLPFFILARKENMAYPGAAARTLYHAGIATLTVGSLIRGVLVIYGTTNRLAQIYWLVGIPLTVIGFLLCCIQARKPKRTRWKKQ